MTGSVVHIIDLCFHKFSGLSDDIIQEGKELLKVIEEEENEKEALAIQDHNSEEKKEHEIRYKRLMHLLDRSKFYSNFLLERMAAKKEEEKQKVTQHLSYD